MRNFFYGNLIPSNLQSSVGFPEPNVVFDKSKSSLFTVAQVKTCSHNFSTKSPLYWNVLFFLSPRNVSRKHRQLNPFYGTFTQQFITKELARENILNFFRICWFSDHGDNGHLFISFIIVSPMSLHKIQSFPFIAKFCLKVTKIPYEKFCTILKKIISDIIYLLIFGIYFVFVACLFHFYPLCGWVFSKQIFIEAWNNWILVFLRGSA